MKIFSLILMCFALASCWFGEKDKPIPDGGGVDWGNRPKVDVVYELDSNAVVREAGNIWFFIYDETATLVHKFQATEEDIEAGIIEGELPDGKHTIVAWGTEGQNLYDGDNGYKVSGDVVGESKMSDLRVTVDNTESFEELYYASQDVVIVDGGTSNDVQFDFIKETSMLRVTVNGLDMLPGLRFTIPTPDTRAALPLEIYMEGKENIYDYTGRINNNSPVSRFYGVTTEEDANHVVSEIHIQRILIDYHNNNPLLLHVKYGGNDVVTPVDVLDAILANPGYRTQADLDVQYEFDVAMTLTTNENGELVVSVEVDGYDVINNIDVVVEPFY